MDHSAIVVRRFARAALSLVLAVSLAMPVTACQQQQTQSTPTISPISIEESDDVRWANFDDGSDILSLSVPYFHSNVDSLEFNVVLEQGTLAEEIATEAVTLAGALQGWQVESATRTDDVTFSVVAHRPEGLTNNGASIATVSLASQLVVLPEANEAVSEEPLADTSSITAEDIPTAEEIDEMKGAEWPDDAEIIDEDQEAVSVETGDIVADTPAEIEELIEKIEDGTISSEEDLVAFTEGELPDSAQPDEAANDVAGDESTLDAATAYGVNAMFVNPTLSVDFEKSTLEASTFKALLVAGDFVLDESISAASFSLKEAEGCTITEVRRVSATEAEVAIALPSDKDTAALEGATLVLAADANESEAEVYCSITVPQPWLELTLAYQNDQTGTIGFEADLNNSAEDITKDDVSVSVNDTELTDFDVAKNSDGTYDITLDASDVPEGSAVTVDVAEVEDSLGNQVDVEPAAALAQMEEDSRDEDEGGITEAGLLKALGKAGLSALASFGWKQLCKRALDPALGTNLYSVGNNELLSEIVKTQKQITDLSVQINVLSSTVMKGNNANIINEAKRLVSRIKTREIQLADYMNSVYSEADPAKREKLIKDFAQNEKNTIDALATNLGELYDVVMQADSATNHDLITVYDDMMAQSYNWGAQTYVHRQNFRNNLAAVWVNGVQIVGLAYGVTNTKTTYLDNLDIQTQNLNTLIGVTKAISETDQKVGNAYYCNTTGAWYTSLIAADTVNKWDGAFRYVRSGSKRELLSYMKSPFRDYKQDKPLISWDGSFINTAETKLLATKLHDGQTLKEELEQVGLATTKYLLTSERMDFRERLIFAYNDWYFDTFEVANVKQDGGGFTAEKRHFDGSKRLAVVVYVLHIKSSTSLDEMFVLQQTTVAAS